MEELLFTVKKLIPQRIFLFFRPRYHFILAFLAALILGFPSRRITVIGVTGTKGKTTTVELLHEILAEAGHKTASLSSLRFKIGEKEVKNERKMTMPGRFFVQKFLYDAAKKKCRYAVIEVTSEGIRQFRHRFIRFRMAVMVNVAPEHIESHGGYEPYLRAKLDLFWRLSKDATAVINRDDREWKRFSSATEARKIFYDTRRIVIGEKTLEVKNVEHGERGIVFDAGVTEFVSPLMGEFNLQNILAAISAAAGLHIDLAYAARAIARVAGIPGRMEFVQKSPFAVVIDYAHTPDSLRKVYGVLRSLSSKLQTPNPKLICVLGAAGGGRDKWKRRKMGEIASEFCSRIILTDEDPYDEDPESILAEVASGISGNNPVHKKVLDRRSAIREAILAARAGDTVVITGKGAEPWIMGPNRSKIPWDDREVAKEELQSIMKL